LLDQQRGALSGEFRELEEALASVARHGRHLHSRAAFSAVKALHRQCVKRLSDLLASSAIGKRLCQPTKVVIAGRANVGKSTLLNALCREARAITSDRSGTTRDFVSGQIVLKGYPFELIDTAGIRASCDIVEVESVRGSWEQITKADVVVFLLDGSRSLEQEDRDLAKRLSGCAVLSVINKCDCPVNDEVQQLAGLFDYAPVRIAALSGQGIGRFKDELLTACGIDRFYSSSTPTLFADRQIELVREALAKVSDHENSAGTAEQRRELIASTREAAKLLKQCRNG